MLQQMSSPYSAQAGEVATHLRPFEGRPRGNSADDYHLPLPQCKTRRNYSCSKCCFHTRNSRDYLVHARDVHFEKIKIYDCPHCAYASKHHQKLLRHMKIHFTLSATSRMDPDIPSPFTDEMGEPLIRVEDYLEEVEECGEEDDMENMDMGESEEQLERSADLDGGRPRPDEPTTSNASIDPKQKFFSCDKCTYVTHIRGRYTKHVKYHSMPMIKCELCDFRTPYKWNLDRHNRNHGGSGSFLCSMCNFTADIKQSLTVHEMNHHTPPAGAGQSGVCRRRNRVGASDAPAPAPATAPARGPGEDDGGGDSRSSVAPLDMGLLHTDKDMVNCNSDSNDATAHDASAKKDGLHLAQGSHNQQSPNDEGKSQKQNRKTPRPPPPLIPINTSTPNQTKSNGEPPQKKFKEAQTETVAYTQATIPSKKFENLPVDITLTPVTNNTATPAKESIVRKKNNSFFDKLKERLLTETGEEGSLICKSCGFESKCLSEHSVHEKNCAILTSRMNNTNTSIQSLGSTRCQNCRHRCKSSADLQIHMRTCSKPGKIEQVAEQRKEDNNQISPVPLEKNEVPHPMENVVFVWNNFNDSNKFEMPLDININDDSTLPDQQRSYELEVVDETESMNLSPSQAAGKKVFKCPHCPFWASTASRFHVHIVGHLNKKPFECSLCKYKSNWRWDITKHIKLKSARDPEHNEAKVLMTDETGRRNYSKYNKFLAMPILNEHGENEFHYIDPSTTADASMDIDDTFEATDGAHNTFEMQPLNLQTQHSDNREDDPRKTKKTLWKCKKCNYKDPSKEALLEHVREHSNQEGSPEDPKNKKPDNTPDPADLAYRCGHCNQLSNWKHVIQRHCRLKHDGIIKVITTVKPRLDSVAFNEMNTDTCNKCPFKATDKKVFQEHMQHHQPSPQSIFKCYFCPYFVKDEHELVQHLLLHGITEPEDYIAKAMDGKSPIYDAQSPSCGLGSTKRHKCTECPYETNSKSQFMYHEQFHRLPADTPYKCPECNYSVSKRHLLHQHLRVHGIITKKSEIEAELESAASDSSKTDYPPLLEETPYVWVSAKNEFHKMYKCRYCSYVNSQKGKIPDHEKIHCFTFDNSDVILYKCLECKFTCDHAGKLADHSKGHAEIYGRIYCPVEEDVSDADQITKLRKVVENEKLNLEDIVKEEGTHDQKENQLLYFCHKCPARFFSANDLKVHDTFHGQYDENKCKYCDFSANDLNDVTAHHFVHSDEYHTKTKMLKFMHNGHQSHKEPKTEMIHCAETQLITWVVSSPSKNFGEPVKKLHDSKHTPKQYSCKECPAKFFKSSALSYHMGLHGGDGEHKCKKCSYSVKNLGNLAKHEALHEIEGKSANCEYDSGDDVDYKNVPLSGTDLFQRKTEAQKKVFTDKDKLVKPNDHFPPVLQADPQFGYLMHGNPEFIYPTYLKNGRQKEKRYKCHKCPSAFEKREQYKIHLSLHGSKQRYKCELCDYSVKYYANYVQHMRKHQMNDEAQAERKKETNDLADAENQEDGQEDTSDTIKLAIKTMPKGAVRSDFQQFSVSDQQTLRLLQRRRSMNTDKDVSPDQPPAKDRKLHMCVHCPYSNQRLDALIKHDERHQENDVVNAGTHKCSFCGLAVVQSHFLRDHLKTHFVYMKNLIPECYVANHDVSFTITKLEDESDSTEVKINLNNNSHACSEEKIYVKVKTGEIVVE